MKSDKLLMGILAGFAGGVLAGLLMAPEKGSDMRQNILNKSEDYTGTVKDKFNEIINAISQKYQSTKDDAEDMVDEGKSQYNEMISEGKDKYQSAKNDVMDSIA